MCVITYIVARLPYSIFPIQYTFSARSLTYEMLRWAILTDHYFVSGLLYFLMSGLSLTLRFEEWCSHSVICKAVSDTQFVSVFLIGQMMVQMDIFAWLWLSLYYMELWLSLLLYSSLWHILAFSVMIWRS